MITYRCKAAVRRPANATRREFDEAISALRAKHSVPLHPLIVVKRHRDGHTVEGALDQMVPFKLELPEVLEKLRRS